MSPRRRRAAPSSATARRPGRIRAGPSHPGPVKAQPGGGRDPSGRHHGQRGVDAVLPVAGRMDKPHTGRTALEAVDRPGPTTTWTPAAAIAAATASETSWSSLIKMRGATSTMDPWAERVKDRCHLHAGRPAPITISDGAPGEVPGVAVGRGQVEPEPPAAVSSSGAEDDFVGPNHGALRCRWYGRRRSAPGHLLVDAHPSALQIVAQQRVLASVRGHVADGAISRGSRAQVRRPRSGTAGAAWPRGSGAPPGPACAPERPVIRGHSPELIAGDQRRASSQTGRTKRRDDPRRPCADDHDVEQLTR